MTGLLGGGHAIVWDGERARNLDCFVAVPSGSGPPMVDVPVPFGEETVHYAVGPASCGVPGLPAGLDALWREHGRLPWARLVEPALRLARERDRAAAAACGVPGDARAGDDAEPRGRALLARRAAAREPATGSSSPDSSPRSRRSPRRAPRPCTGARSPRRCSRVERHGRDADRSRGLRGRSGRSRSRCRTRGTRFLTRGGLSGVPGLLRRLPRLAGLSADRARAGARGRVRRTAAPDGHTTNLCVVDARGHVPSCSRRASGSGSGDFLPGLDLHLNSMLGEHDLIDGPLVPGTRMQSMMAPSVALDGDGLVAGDRLGRRDAAPDGARARSRPGVLDEGLAPQAAVDRPRVHPAGGTINAEPGVDEEALRAARGRPGAPCGAGPISTTTSAARASSLATAPAPTPSGRRSVRAPRV